MKKDPPSLWESEYSQAYDDANYGRNMTGFVMNKSHQLIEKDFGNSTYFSKIIEVGAGSGAHLPFVKHAYDEYFMTDGSIEMLNLAKKKHQSNGRVKFSVSSAENLEYADNTFDRLIASHVLEHLKEPHEVLKEWNRVVKPGGTISIILPCDPGMLWRLGRNFGPRRNAESAGIPYDYIMAREHINSITNLRALINYYFDQLNEKWWPTPISFTDINLIYCVNIIKT
ncbi:class I SAM-dependent methyltransferase [Comamonas terrigena]|uniref:class I SAM-dependent methyltransferase n=1 Tax=Comamonas terrigena TaxID=32013 RepID=UPI0023579163|nr:class I SAM-dependent methyltransferase [Comamonas terrigena]